MIMIINNSSFFFFLFEAFIDLFKSLGEKYGKSTERNGALAESSPYICKVEDLHHKEALIDKSECKPFISGCLGIILAKEVFLSPLFRSWLDI